MSLKMDAAPRIEYTRCPNFPQFTFEFHVATGKVYLVEDPGPGNVARGVAIAEHCDTHARFYGFVQTWLRGYRKALCDENVGTA